MLTLSSYMKAILQACVPLIVLGAVWSQTGVLNAQEVSLAVLAVLGTLAVLVTKNRGAGWKRAAKFIVSASAALVTAVVTALFTGGWGIVEWRTLLVGFATSVLLYLATSGGSPPPAGNEPGAASGASSHHRV